MRAGLSMGQLDTVKAFLLEQAVRVDEAKVTEEDRVVGRVPVFFFALSNLVYEG